MARQSYIFKKLNNGDYGAYDKLANSYGTMFTRSEWLSVTGSEMQRYGLYTNEGQLVGGIAIYEQTRCGLKIIRRAPYTQHCGPFFRPNATRSTSIVEEQDRVLRSLCSFLESVRPVFCSLPLDPRFRSALPFFWAGYKVIPKISYQLQLEDDIDKLWEDVASKCRNNIRKAQKDGIEIVGYPPIEQVVQLVSKTFQRNKKRLPHRSVEVLTQQFSSEQNSFWFVAYFNKKPSSCCFFAHDETTAYNLLSGYDHENAHHGAGPAAMWEAIKHAKGRGLQIFDFEGSMLPDVEPYIRQFGGQRSTYLTVNKAWLPLEMAIKPLKRNIF